MQHLARGLTLLEKSEFDARQDAEQMKLVISEFRAAYSSLEAIDEDAWNGETFGTELSRGLACVENARMEWNAARVRFPILSGKFEAAAAPTAQSGKPALSLENMSLGQLCKIGFALTWPLMAVAVLALGLMVFLLLRQ